MPAFFRAGSGPGWALAGDSGHFKDPVMGQGQRDALWMGRTLGEAAAAALDDPAALDGALRRWERERDEECLSAYHFANGETRIRMPPPSARRGGPPSGPTGTASADIGDIFQRIRSQQEVMPVGRVISAAAGAAARRPRAALGMLRDLVPDVRTEAAILAEARARRFRSTRIVSGSEHPGWEWPDPPRTRSATR